uniref:Kazal-like domain-containing protein n=1 Tax=Bactrocera latifrons TaxID=174628 RepID=A0A0K8UK26_BACLA
MHFYSVKKKKKKKQKILVSIIRRYKNPRPSRLSRSYLKKFLTTMKVYFTFGLVLALWLAMATGFRRCVITDYDCTVNQKICARGPFGQCRTFKNPCTMQMENCHRFIPFTQTVTTDCNGLADDTLGSC